MATKTEQTYDFISFSDLAYELKDSAKHEAEKKIQRKLAYYNLGAFSQDRINYLRKLRDDLYKEIRRKDKSKYFSKTNSKQPELGDFNLTLMQIDYLKTYDKIEASDMYGMLNFAIYLYYLR